jgi:hypothetical protein
VLTDAGGLPLAVATSAANTHDSLALIPLVQAIPAIRSRRGPRRRRPAKLHADKGYDYPHLRAWLRRRRITPRIARRGIETSERLGRHRWVVERSLAWLTGYRRLTLRYERCARLFTAFLTLAAALTCYKEARHMRQALTKHARGRKPHHRAAPAPCRSASRGRSLAIPTGGSRVGSYFPHQPVARRRLAPRYCGLTTGYR